MELSISISYVRMPENWQRFLDRGSRADLFEFFGSVVEGPTCETETAPAPFMAVYDQILRRMEESSSRRTTRIYFPIPGSYRRRAGASQEYTRDLHHSEMAEGNVMTEYEAKFSAQGEADLQAGGSAVGKIVTGHG